MVGLATAVNKFAGPPCFLNRLIQNLHGVVGGILGAGVGIEGHCIASGHHANGVANHGAGGVGAGRQRADNAIRCPFGDRQTAVTAPGRGF